MIGSGEGIWLPNYVNLSTRWFKMTFWSPYLEVTQLERVTYHHLTQQRFQVPAIVGHTNPIPFPLQNPNGMGEPIWGSQDGSSRIAHPTSVRHAQEIHHSSHPRVQKQRAIKLSLLPPGHGSEEVKNRGTPKWMVKIMENPILNGWFWGYPYFWKHLYILTCIVIYLNIHYSISLWNGLWAPLSITQYNIIKTQPPTFIYKSYSFSMDTFGQRISTHPPVDLMNQIDKFFQAEHRRGKTSHKKWPTGSSSLFFIRAVLLCKDPMVNFWEVREVL